MTATRTQPTRSDAAGKAPQLSIALLDTNEAAAALKMGRRTLQEKVAAREIGCIKLGRSIRFHPDDIAAFIEANRVKARGWKGGAR